MTKNKEFEEIQALFCTTFFTWALVYVHKKQYLCSVK